MKYEVIETRPVHRGWLNVLMVKLCLPRRLGRPCFNSPAAPLPTPDSGGQFLDARYPPFSSTASP